MAFFYTVTKEITFDKTDYWIKDLPTDFNRLFKNALRNIGYTYEDNTFLSSHSLFNIPFRFDVDIELNSQVLLIKYRLYLQNLMNVIIAILLVLAFISKFEFGTFLWVSFVIGIVFYQLSLLIINTGIKKQFNRILSAYKKVKEESDIEYWVKENDRNCPACGALLDNQTLFCKECGLKIRQNAYSKPLNINPENIAVKHTELKNDK